MNIFLTDLLNIENFVIPVVPLNLSVNLKGDNKEEDTLDGKINVMKNSMLRTVAWSSFFPVNKDYKFVRQNSLRNGWLYVAFLESMKTLRTPIRIILTTSQDNRTVLNMTATIDEFNCSVDNAEDIQYSIRLKEFAEGFFETQTRRVAALENAQDFIRANDRRQRLIDAGLFVVNRRYK